MKGSDIGKEHDEFLRSFCFWEHEQLLSILQASPSSKGMCDPVGLSAHSGGCDMLPSTHFGPTATLCTVDPLELRAPGAL